MHIILDVVSLDIITYNVHCNKACSEVMLLKLQKISQYHHVIHQYKSNEMKLVCLLIGTSKGDAVVSHQGGQQLSFLETIKMYIYIELSLIK